MIPKIIHYCWFGGNPLPQLAKECIKSWKKYLPEYHIIQWSEESKEISHFNKDDWYPNEIKAFDTNMIPYTKEAYLQRKYAFVSDYARFWIMYHYGGIYFDTDVEVIRPLDDIIAKGNFMGYEVEPDGENSPLKYAPRYAYGVAVGLGFGMEKNHSFIKKMMEIYEAFLEFSIEPAPWGQTVVSYVSMELVERGLLCKPGIQKIGDITVYPREYFAPINVITGRLTITKNTRSIHRYMGSWGFEEKSWKKIVKSHIPEFVFYLYNKIKRRKYQFQ